MNVLVNQLTHQEYAQLIISLGRASKAEILIFNHIIEYLDTSFLEKAIELSDDYIKNELTLIIIDDDIDKIEKVSNYVAWISHGQLRMEGSLNQVLPVFREHEIDRQSLNSVEEKGNFDLDWKKNRTRIPEMSYNFKRIERYKHAKAPEYIVKFWTILISLILCLCLAGSLVLANKGKLQIANNVSQSKIQNQNSDPYEEKLGYGLVLDDKMTLNGNKNITVPQYTLLTIIAENSKNYKVTIDDKNYVVGKSDLTYFNPAALYETHQFKNLSKYMKSNYSNYVDYYNSHLHQPHAKVKKTLVPSKDNRFVVNVTEQPVDMLFDDENKLKGFVYPITNKEDLKKKYNIKKDVWITKSNGGYLIANMQDSKWIYIEL